MIGEDRREEIEAHLDSLKELRKAYLSHYRFMERNASEEYLSSILEDVHQLEEEIMEVRKQLPSPMSQRQLRALEDIPKVWAEVTGKKAREEALCKAADKTLQEYADIAAGRIFIDADNVAHVNGTIETPRMVIEEAPMRRGLTIKEWFQKWCK